ncbi:DNA polymerase III subunit gamma/tau [Candidatus Berkelbacteria bacterium]|nr:DNA polymerase III subunit gamma/tau [Candidatus Berkelbacteria bacterium]
MNFYRTYRPQKFAELVGQEHVKRTLANAVQKGEVAHAYLFSGPRGVGKTSVARILAMALNCADQKTKNKPPKKTYEPCGQCQVCQAIRAGNNLNVIEIDAASNRGIDEIRSLKESVNFKPSNQNYRVYIIDEVHMLTKEAFNALLKTLEEPPSHAIFILATTELYKVPETIISRTQHFEFKRALNHEIVDHLRTIAGREKIIITDEALDLVALHADGGLRDALSLLDQLAALGADEITTEQVRFLLGIAPEAELIELLGVVLTGQLKLAHSILEKFAQHGYDPAVLADDLIMILRHGIWLANRVQVKGSEGLQKLFERVDAKKNLAELVALIRRLFEAKQQQRWAPTPMLPLELALIDIKSVRGAESQKQTQVEAPTQNSLKKKPGVETAIQRESLQSNAEDQKPSDLSALWQKIITLIHAKNAPLAALLRSAKLVSLEETTCQIEVPFGFYADRVRDRKNAAILGEVFQAVVGRLIQVHCQVGGKNLATAQTRTALDLEADVLEVFGQEKLGEHV